MVYAYLLIREVQCSVSFPGLFFVSSSLNVAASVGGHNSNEQQIFRRPSKFNNKL